MLESHGGSVLPMPFHQHISSLPQAELYQPQLPITNISVIYHKLNCISHNSPVKKVVCDVLITIIYGYAVIVTL